MKQLSLGLLALMSTCAQRPAPPVPVSVPQGTSVSSAALVGSYAVQSRVPNFTQPVYDRLRYTLRASTLRGYEGWDVLRDEQPLTAGAPGRSSVLEVRLNRPARAAVIVRTARPPRWARDWKVGTPVVLDGEAYLTYVRDVPAGWLRVDASADPQSGPGRSPWLLLAEAGGKPSPAPRVPPGRTLPAPNAPCPGWVHDAYRATGPDGKTYPTWHPQIDPVYWCTFGHEHGSQPPAGVTPLYGYVAARHGMTEPHAGFKTYTVQSGEDRWTFTQHFGTSGVGRACTRFHSVDVAFTRRGVLKADLHFMGDFGNGVAVVRGDTTVPISSCPPQDRLARSTLGPDGQLLTTGTRALLLHPNEGYEPWRLSAERLALGLSLQGLTFDTGDPRTQCAEASCRTLVVRPEAWGVDHRLTFNRPPVLRATREASGVFWTDPTGETLVSAQSPGATRQFLAPGTDVTGPSGTCWTPDAWAGLMACGGTVLAPSKVLEDSIAPDGGN